MCSNTIETTAAPTEEVVYVSNGFKEHELVKVQGRDFPVVGGRLRVLHEMYGNEVSIETQIVEHRAEMSAVVTARVTTAKGMFSATGTSSASRDPKLIDALLELAETRAIARALRWAGIGVECCGYEELGSGEVVHGDSPRQDGHRGSPESTRHGGNGRHRPTPATAAQRRALVSIAGRIGRELDTIVAEVYPDHGANDLSLAQASQLIDRLKMKNGNGNGHQGDRR